MAGLNMAGISTAITGSIISLMESMADMAIADMAMAGIITIMTMAITGMAASTMTAMTIFTAPQALTARAPANITTDRRAGCMVGRLVA
jgi:hypothetical protein